MNKSKLALIFMAAAVAACGGDKSADTASTKAAADSVGADAIAYREQQKKYADSIFNSAASARDVATRLGASYEVGSIRLRDSVALLAEKSECFKKGRQIDPFLSGVATMWVNMSVIGSDVVRVQESSWTSGVGKGVELCLNEAARGWKFDPSFGKPKAYLVQLQFKEAAP